MLNFKEFIRQVEYTTAGEADSKNNTDLGEPTNKEKWWANKKKCGLNGLPCSKYSAEMKKESKNS